MEFRAKQNQAPEVDKNSICWSSKIAENKNNFELWKVNLISGKTHQYHVDNISGDSPYVIWPFANQIIYQEKGNKNFYILNTSSGEQKKLLTNEQGWLWGPIYSPDKKKLAVKYNYCMDCESDNRYMKQGLWIIPNQDSLIEDKIRFIKGPYIFPVSWSKNSELIYGWDHNDNKIYSFQEETGSMLDSISLPPLTKQVSIISDGQSFILDIGTESRYDLWYLTNFE